MNKDEYFSRQFLKEQGFTDSLLKQLKPDFINRWGHNKVSYYYEIKKVIEFKESDIYKKHLIGKDKRKESAAKAVNTKTKKLEEKIKSINLTIDNRFDYDSLKKKAVESYNDFKISRNDYDSLIDGSEDKTFLYRICVNYVRHNLTNYEYALSILESKIGKNKAYLTLRSLLFPLISKTYPFLEDECNKQLNYNDYK